LFYVLTLDDNDRDNKTAIKLRDGTSCISLNMVLSLHYLVTWYAK